MVICLRKILFKSLPFLKRANSNTSFLSCLAPSVCVTCSFLKKLPLWLGKDFEIFLFCFSMKLVMMDVSTLSFPDRVETSGYNIRNDTHGTPAINLCHTINLIVSCPRQLSVNNTEEDVSSEKMFCHSAAWWDSAADNKKEITKCPLRRDRREQWWRHINSHQDWSAHHY